jgi:hypothetical protein
MTYQLATAKVWDGSAWVPAVGGSQPWYSSLAGPELHDVTVTPTANTSANTKGAWTEVVASTSATTTAIAVIVGGVQSSSANTATLVDVGVGASGSEQVVAANIAVGGAVRLATRDLSGLWVLLPVAVAAGSRVAVRIQSVVTGGKTASVQCRLFQWGTDFGVPTIVDVLGTSTATSQGASFSGASGTFTEVVASTATAYTAIGMVPSTHNSSILSIAGYLEVAIGAAGSEVVFGVVECFFWNQEGVSSSMSGTSPLFARNVPAGSRLSVRHNIAANPDRYGVTLIGIP